MIRAVVNGKERELPQPLTVAEFLELHQINPLIVAVELRGEVIRREQFSEALIQDGDQLEIVRMIGGGSGGEGGNHAHK